MENLPYSILDKALSKRKGKSVYVAYRHFKTRELAQIWIKNNEMPYRCEIVYYPTKWDIPA